MKKRRSVGANRILKEKLVSVISADVYLEHLMKVATIQAKPAISEATSSKEASPDESLEIESCFNKN